MKKAVSDRHDDGSGARLWRRLQRRWRRARGRINPSIAHVNANSAVSLTNALLYARHACVCPFLSLSPPPLSPHWLCACARLSFERSPESCARIGRNFFLFSFLAFTQRGREPCRDYLFRSEYACTRVNCGFCCNM